MGIPNDMYQGSLPTEKRDDRDYEMEFRDVSFKYPNSEVWALRHVNMKFKIGSRLAVVGMNGSAKPPLSSYCADCTTRQRVRFCSTASTSENTTTTIT